MCYYSNMQLNKTFISTFKNKKNVFCLLGLVFYVVFIISIFIPKRSKIYGAYNYTVDEVVVERIVLRIDNTASYYQNKNGQLVEWNDGAVKKWRAVLNRTEVTEYLQKDLHASVIQIQICNSSNKSFFQLFKISNEMLYSKLGTGGVNYQKCFLKE